MAYVGICRLGDVASGWCSGHKGTPATTGTITSASGNVYANSVLVARNGDIVTGSCGHTGVITATGSVMINGYKAARVGDSFTGTFFGTLTSGSASVLSNS